MKYAIIGLQGSERMNRDFYGRKETNASFVKACDMMADMGINYSVDLIIDTVYETEDDLREIARTLNRLHRPFRVRAFSMTPFPGTELYDQAAADGLLEKFASDAYELGSFYNAQLVADRPGVYKTPTYWSQLIGIVIPLYRNRTIDRLIEAGPHDAAAAAEVERWYRKAYSRWLLVELLRAKTPRLFDMALDVYLWCKRWREGRGKQKVEEESQPADSHSHRPI